MLTRKLIFIESPVTTLPSRSTGPRYRADLPGQFSFDSTGPIFVVGASPTAQTHPLVKVRFYPCWGCSACVVKTPLPPFGLSGGLGSSVFNQPFSPIFTNFVSAGCVRPALAPCLYKTGALTVRRRLLPRRRIGHDGTLAARARGGRRCSVAGRASVACCSGKRCRQANAAGLARHNTLLRSANAPPDDEARLFVLTETSVVPAASLNGCSVLADPGLHKNKENEWRCRHHLQGLGCPSAESRRGQ